jgi:hypothetical protein
MMHGLVGVFAILWGAALGWADSAIWGLVIVAALDGFILQSVGHLVPLQGEDDWLIVGSG